MHPTVKKYAEFVKLHMKFEEECKIYEQDFKAFFKQVEQFQKTIDEWVHTNRAILQQMPVPEKEHVSHLMEIMKSGTKLSHSMSHLYDLQTAYLKYCGDFSDKLLAMNANLNPEQVINALPKIKALCKENHPLIKTKINVLKLEMGKVEKQYNELQFIYKKALS